MTDELRPLPALPTPRKTDEELRRERPELFSNYLVAIERERRESVLTVNEAATIDPERLKGIQTRRLIRANRTAYLSKRSK